MVTGKTFPVIVRRARARAGLSQSELAKKVGISRNYLSQIECGIATNLSANIKTSLCVVLGIGDVRAEIPQSLKEFASSEGLPDADVSMLAGIEYRGKRAGTVLQWRLLYAVIVAVLGVENTKTLTTEEICIGIRETNIDNVKGMGTDTGFRGVHISLDEMEKVVRDIKNNHSRKKL